MGLNYRLNCPRVETTLEVYGVQVTETKQKINVTGVYYPGREENFHREGLNARSDLKKMCPPPPSERGFTPPSVKSGAIFKMTLKKFVKHQ